MECREWRAKRARSGGRRGYVVEEVGEGVERNVDGGKSGSGERVVGL